MRQPQTMGELLSMCSEDVAREIEMSLVLYGVACIEEIDGGRTVIHPGDVQAADLARGPVTVRRERALTRDHRSPRR